MISSHPALFLPIGLWLLGVLGLYGLLSFVRIWALHGKSGLEALEARIAANLSNQFEAPLLMLVAVVLLLMEGAITSVVVSCVWVFWIGRVLHSIVQISQPRVVPRGLVFTINFLAIVTLWGILTLRVMGISV